MDSDPNRTALREAKRIQNLDGCNGVCVICGEPSLITVTVEFAEEHGIPRCLIEIHHAVCRRRDPDLHVPLCLTHHWMATVGLLRENIGTQCERNKVERIAHCLIALANFLEMLAPAIRRWAAKLKETL
jgi:hypothetical protein